MTQAALAQFESAAEIVEFHIAAALVENRGTAKGSLGREARAILRL